MGITYSSLARLYSDSDSRSLLARDLYIGKHRDAYYVYSVECQESPCDGGCLYGLIDCPCADCLDVRAPALADNTGDSSSDSR